MEQEIGLESGVQDVLDMAHVLPDLVEPEPTLEVAPVAPLAPVAPVLQGGLLAASRSELAIKRAIDIFVSVLALLLLTPLLLVVAAAVGLTSAGPIFYIQQRVGRDGTPIRMFKFRSMYDHAHDHREEHVERNMHNGPIFKIRDDPRITPVGRIIRRFSIDELPQLFNVLIGQMSLVGPRPPLPEEFVYYGPRERLRLLAKPGVTCIWQVSGRSNLDFDTWMNMDLEYIQNWSLWLDLKLLGKTVPAVLTGRGAY
jgi:exopolysaccharide biosynthesis polyprenyl glycosylphosphotransferase